MADLLHFVDFLVSNLELDEESLGGLIGLCSWVDLNSIRDCGDVIFPRGLSLDLSHMRYLDLAPFFALTIVQMYVEVSHLSSEKEVLLRIDEQV